MVSSVPVTLDANEHKAFTIGDLLNQPIQPNIQSGVITNASGVIGLELFGNNGGSNHLDGLLLTDKTASTLYYPHVENNGWWTGIVAYNPSVSASTITVAPYSAQGTALATSTLPLAGKGKYVGLVSGLGLPAQTAWFRIDSTQPLSGFELFSTLDGNLLAAYAGGGGIGATTGVFAKIEKNGGWTGIAFVNTEVGAATVTLTAYDDNGSVVATQVLPVGGHAKVVNLAETIFSQDISSATYIAYSSDRNVVGFQLNGSADGTMLDGLPGLGGAPQLSVNTVSPENGATNVPTTAPVSVAFNEAMNSTTINATTFTVSAGGAPVAGVISSSGTTYAFTPAAPLAAGTMYTVTVTTGAMDVTGNTMAANFTSTFTTAAAGPVTRDVSIGDFAFSPATITINVGDTVRWTNNGAIVHSTTSGTSPTADGKWDSGLLSNGQSFSFTFTQAGTYSYFCSIHFFTGTVIVQTSGVNGTIMGTAIKGPINGATVTAFAINNGVMGTQIGTAATDAQGNFTMSVGAYSGPVMLRMTGGTYTDEATGTSMTMQSGDIMTTMLPQVTAGAVMSGVQITPLTSMAQAMAQTMSGGMTPANITTANTAMGNYFSVSDILFTHPMNPLTPGSGTGATQDMRNYGMVIAAMSKYAQTIGMPISSGMVTAMMNDAADGVMNGMMGNTQIMMGGMGGMMGNNPMSANAGTSGLAGAMTAFMGSAMNRSGLTVADMQALINKMNTSSGQVQ